MNQIAQTSAFELPVFADAEVPRIGFYVGVFPVWFDASVYDTDDISTVRGASMALLFVPSALARAIAGEFTVTVSAIICGASEMVLHVKSTGADGGATGLRSRVAGFVRQWLSGKQALLPPLAEPSSEGGMGAGFDLSVLRHAVISLACSEGDAGLEPLVKLRALAAVQQYALPSVQIGAKVGESHCLNSVCVLDGVSPASGWDGPKEIGKPASAMALQRKRFGRERKQDFYRFVLADSDLRGAAEDLAKMESVAGGFSQTLDDLAKFRAYERAVDRRDSLPIGANLTNKIAIIHLDGNKFGRLFSNLSGLGAVASVSSQLKTLQANMMVRLLDWILSSGTTAAKNDMIAPARKLPEMKDVLKDRIRLETLMWGGDEMVFALPAWRGWEAAAVLEAALREFVLRKVSTSNGVQDVALTHAIGLAFANVKTPIRTLKSVANSLAEAAKLPGKDIFAWQVGIAETMDVAGGTILPHRNAFFGTVDTARLAFAAREGETAENKAMDWVAVSRRLAGLERYLGQSQVTKLLDSGRELPKDQREETITSRITARYGPEGTAKDIIEWLTKDHRGKTVPAFDTLLWLRYLNGYVLPVPPVSPLFSSPIKEGDGDAG